MTVPGTRVVAFIPRKTGVGRATLIVNPIQHRALLLADQLPPEAAARLRLWGARGPNVPIPLAPVSFVAADGVAAADLGSSLFEPAPPDQLVLSPTAPTRCRRGRPSHRGDTVIETVVHEAGELDRKRKASRGRGKDIMANMPVRRIGGDRQNSGERRATPAGMGASRHALGSVS
jgi:hypothetical protein